MADSKSPIAQTRADYTTAALCSEKRNDRHKEECKITAIPESPVFNTFHIRLLGDEEEHDKLSQELQNTYGNGGPTPENETYQKYKIQPGSLRAVRAY